MDPLSVAATIAGVATAAFQIIGYLGTVAAGGKERLSLLNEVTHLWLTITALQAQIDGDGSIGEQKLFHPQLLSLFAANGIIKDIETLVLDLDTQLKSRSTHGKVRQTLAWPFTQKDVLQTVEQVHRLQQTLQFALAQSNHSLTQAIYQDTQTVKTVINETQMKEMIEWLSPLNFVAKQHLLFKEHHEGTCKWFLDCDDFREWKEGDNAILFCPGIPGAGKTFLSSIVINELDRLRLGEEGGLKDAAILMLYCKWDDSLSQSIDALVASLLKQIAQRYSPVSEKMIELFSRHSRAGTKPGREEIISVLGTELARFPKTFIIVDGLDELRDEKGRLALLDTLGSTGAKVNLMVTSRPLNNIVQHFQDQEYHISCDGCGRRDQPYQHHCSECYEFDLCQSCVDEGKHCGHKGHPSFKQFNSFIVQIAAVEEDLLTYVQWRIASSDFLKQCVELKEGLMTDIIDIVVKANDGMFLLAKFNMDTLASKLRPGEVAAALRILPKELDGTYTDAMLRICDLPSNQKEVVMEFLCWVVFAEQPLQISEMEHAIAVVESDRDIDHDNIVRASVLASMCAGLVQFDESDCIRLVHYSAENFFRQNRDRWFPAGSRKLTSTCLTYLLFEPFKDGACSGPSESADFDDRLEKYPFLSYAAKNWGKHLLQTPQDDFYDKARRLLTDNGYLATSTQALWYLENEDSTSWAGKDGSSALHLATHFGLDKLVAELLDQGVDPNTKDANGATPLALAAERGIVDVAKTLIQAGASVNTLDNVGAAPLHEAAEYDQEEIVKLLLEQKDINVNISHPRRSQYTPLMLAAAYGYTNIVKLLLSMPQLEINKCWSDSQGETALMAATRSNELEVVQILLTHPGIDIDYQEPSGSTALIYAAEEGYTDIAEALLDSGANPEVLQKDTEGTALLRAIDGNSIPVVELLLRRGANAHHKDCFGRGMLHGAACNGRTKIIRILLDFDKTLDVNMRDINGKTTLHDVARLGYEETAATLLEYGADPRIKDNYNRTPINVAREMNHLNILKMLREARRKQKGMAKRTRTLDTLPPKRTDTGTIIQSPVRTDTEVSIETPLAFWALASADLTSEIQTRLSDESCDEINSKDPDMGQTALHFAALNNNVEIARLLISHGADINIFNNWGRTPLHLTVMNNNPEVAEILLDAGADINAWSQWIDTPLLYASSLWTICTLLVERGADLSDERLPLNRLLEIAVTDGSAVAVRRLVAAGAEVWKKNGYGQTPFTIARYYEHDDIANLLLEVGQSPSATPSMDSATTDGGIITEDKGRNDTESTSLVESDQETDTALTGSSDAEDGKIYEAKMASQFLDHAEAEIMKPTQSVKQAPTVVPTALKISEGNKRRIRLLDSTAWITIAILTLIAAAVMIRRS